MDQVRFPLDWRRLRPEEKVKVALDMVDLVTRIAADSERDKNPKIKDSELISRLRPRFQKERRFPARR